MQYPDSINIRHFMDRMGRVRHQPLAVKMDIHQQAIVNYRAPAAQLRQLIPNCLQIDEAAQSGLGIISVMLSELAISHLGQLPMRKLHSIECQYGIHVLLKEPNGIRRARYIFRSDVSLPALMLPGPDTFPPLAVRFPIWKWFGGSRLSSFTVPLPIPCVVVCCP